MAGKVQSFRGYYTALDGISPRFQADIARETEGQQLSYQKALTAQRWITSQVRYNLNAERVPAGSDPVEHFIYESKEGYCDLFASAMTLAARSMGMPSRIAIARGFKPIGRRKTQPQPRQGAAHIPHPPRKGRNRCDGRMIALMQGSARQLDGFCIS
jgi:transglutaminase-like putative cysteine protease